MNLKKRAIEGIVVASTLVMMCSIAEAAETVTAETVTVAVETRADLATNGTAGVVVQLDQVETDAMNSMEVAAVSIEQTGNMLVASAGEPEDEAAQADEPELTEEESAWQNQLMADVEEFLYIRAAADENAEIVGKLYKGDVAQIVEAGEEWTHIISGSADGYVNNAYCLVGAEAQNYATANFETEAEIKTDGLRIRSDADADSPVITAVSTGTTLTVDHSVETTDEWVAVKYNGNTAYVSAEYVTTDLALGEAVTIEEEQAALAKAAEEAAAAKAAQVTETTTVQNSAVSASTDDVTLLAAIIQCEAGNEGYEGQLAVGAVVMNRMRSGRYPGSVYGVIYQNGQFPPAGNGMVANIAARGPKASCIQAAQEALAGADNTGGATSFKRASSGHAGVVIGNHVFF